MIYFPAKSEICFKKLSPQISTGTPKFFIQTDLSLATKFEVHDLISVNQREKFLSFFSSTSSKISHSRADIRTRSPPKGVRVTARILSKSNFFLIHKIPFGSTDFPIKQPLNHSISASDTLNSRPLKQFPLLIIRLLKNLKGLAYPFLNPQHLVHQSVPLHKTFQLIEH